MLKAITLPLILCLLTTTLAFTWQTKSLDFGFPNQETLTDSEMKFFSFRLSEAKGASDLLIEAKVIASGKNEDPLLIASTKPLPNNDKSARWVCGQLGSETCFIPNKYILNTSTVYIGIICEECSLRIKASYIQEETLQDGENRLFHLRAGDKKVFNLDEFFQAEKDWIQITSLNLKMSKYDMRVEITDKSAKNDSDSTIQVPVKLNWIGGLQAVIRPNSSSSIANSRYIYRVILTAEESGVFNLEARTSKAIIQLEDKSVKFESVKKGQKTCFFYKNNSVNKTDDILVKTKSIRENVMFTVIEGKTKSASEFLLQDKKDLKMKLKNGDYVICATTDKQVAFFSMQVFLESSEKRVKEYNGLLYSKLINKIILILIIKIIFIIISHYFSLDLLNKSKGDDIYDVSLQRSIDGLPAFRSLIEEDKNEETTFKPAEEGTTFKPAEEGSTATQAEDDNKVDMDNSEQTFAPVGDEKGLPINGVGVGGIAVVIIFMIPVLIASCGLMGTFVNTKYMSEPIRIKPTD